MSIVLTYVRPWSRDQFVDLARRIWPHADVRGVSEHRTIDEVGLHEGFYRAFSQRSDATGWLELTEDEREDVIIRCRFLRNIPRERADRFVTAMAVAVREVFDREAPEAVLSLTVDHYGMHLLAIACKRKNTPFIGLVASFVNGYFRVTTKGELRALREPTEDEVTAVASALLARAYKPSFLAGSPKAIRATSRELWQRNFVKPLGVRLIRLAKRDLLNQHYAQAQHFADRYWTLTPQRPKGVTLDDGLWREIASQRGRKLYLPLQMSPEATIDYWSADKSWIDYENRVLSLCDGHADDTFLVKEHPNVIGYRSRKFYRRLSARANVVMIAPEISSNLLVERSDGVVVCTGTVGFEASLRGKPVYSDSAPFYSRQGDLCSIAELKARQADPVPTTLSEREQRERVRHVLTGMLPGRVVYDGSWRDRNADLHNEVVNSLRTYRLGI